MFRTHILAASVALLGCIVAVPVRAQTVTANTYGQPGLIDMPSAYVYPDGEIVLTSSHFTSNTRHTFAFQIAPRLMGSFEYSLLYNLLPNANSGKVYDYIFDRSFSLRYQILREGQYMPAVSAGLNDFLGTGIYAGEYVVATKKIGEALTATAGLGWGRLAGFGSFENPLNFLGDRFENRNSDSFEQGGKVEYDRWFTGPAAAFAGLTYAPDDRWTILAEYSSDAYEREAPSAFTRNSPFNFGLRYKLTDNVTLGAQYLYGSEIGVQASFATNPLDPPRRATRETAPPLVGRGLPPGSRGQTDVALAREGIILAGLTITGDTARVEVENDRYMAAAQALGRTARTLSNSLPSDITTFDIVLIEGGLPVTTSRITRQTLETQEFALDGAWGAQTQTRLADAGPGRTPLPGLYPRQGVSIDPYLQPSLFDPDSPVRADIGLALTGFYQPAPGLTFEGSIRQRILGNLDESTRTSNSVLPRVRSDANIYDKEGTALSTLTAAYAFRPGADLYAKVTAGYLERMFGGIATEVLWYPARSHLALGAEIAQVRQRDFDIKLGFQDYQVTTGHVSAYYDFGGGYKGQLDVGRYLAGDYGATIALDRTFENGWSIGAFATLTDVPFSDFGEGSFDKGIQITIPLGFVGGKPGRDTSDLTIRSITRDGGARLAVPNRLYDTVHEANGAEIVNSWGRFWK
ncbi:YjbH domain-containing protein [Loktanella sp. R86503]|uniref:YjbH domain-containing protein n=1 Tax=Loktanella sp. R86503 TaxID=3093847 RepID=UPI0036DC78BD